MDAKLDEIHMSLINGQRRQAVDQIDSYGIYDFWDDYNQYLETSTFSSDQSHAWFVDMTISYHRIKSR